MTKEFRIYGSTELPDHHTIDSVHNVILQAISDAGGSFGGTVIPEPHTELEFYDNLVNDIANTITGMELSGQESDETDKVYVWPQGAHNIAQYVIDMLTKEALI